MEQTLIVTYCWCYNMRQYDARREAEIGSSGTPVDWYAFCRTLCELWLQANPMVVGGLDQNGGRITVEIDESMFFKAKYNRGRALGHGRWVFGGIERETGRCFMVEVPDRSAATLLPLIRQYIRPGSRIVSDAWLAYNNIINIPGQNYTHDIVVHQYNFVDPNDPSVHTQNCENMWMRVKKWIRDRHGTMNIHFTEVLHEWIVRNYFRVQAEMRPGRDFFEEFLLCVWLVYPG